MLLENPFHPDIFVSHPPLSTFDCHLIFGYILILTWNIASLILKISHLYVFFSKCGRSEFLEHHCLLYMFCFHDYQCLLLLSHRCNMLTLYSESYWALTIMEFCIHWASWILWVNGAAKSACFVNLLIHMLHLLIRLHLENTSSKIKL